MVLLGVALVVVWLAVLTMVVVALVRQVTALQLALQQRAPESFSVDADGPVLGTSVDVEIVDVVTASGMDAAGVVALLVLSSTCGPCREVMASFDREQAGAAPIIALVAGSGPPLVEVTALAEERFDVVVSGVAADAAAEALGIHSTPFAVLVRHGIVVAKAYVRTVKDIYEVMRAPAASTPIGLSPREVA